MKEVEYQSIPGINTAPTTCPTLQLIYPLFLLPPLEEGLNGYLLNF